jgi:hypothetical protein
MAAGTPGLPASQLAGRILSGLAVAFLLFSASLKLFATAPATETFARMQLPVEHTFGLGVLELLCTLAYAVPRTARQGAILLTGYLGGAIAAHWRLHDPWFSHTLFPCWVGAFVWGGLLLRDQALRALLLPSRSPLASPPHPTQAVASRH